MLHLLELLASSHSKTVSKHLVNRCLSNGTLTNKQGYGKEFNRFTPRSSLAPPPPSFAFFVVQLFIAFFFLIFLFPSPFSPLFCLCFSPQMVSSLSYPNLLGTKRLGCRYCCKALSYRLRKTPNPTHTYRVAPWLMWASNDLGRALDLCFGVGQITKPFSPKQVGVG
jgi:hypothetical protein